MNRISLTCPCCGEALPVSPQTEALACPSCDADLQLRWDESGGLVRKVESLTVENEILRMELELREMNDRWEAMRATFLLKGRDGPRDPTVKGGRTSIIVGVIVPLFMVISKEPVTIIACVFVGAIMGWFGFNEMAAAQRLARARRYHESKRYELCVRLKAVRQRARKLAQELANDSSSAT